MTDVHQCGPELDCGPEERDQLVVGSNVVLWETSDRTTVCNDLVSGTGRWTREKFYGSRLYPATTGSTGCRPART